MITEKVDDLIIQEEDINQEVQKDKKNGPLVMILALFLILIILALIIPYYAVKLDPEPKNIAKLDEINSLVFESSEINHSITNLNDFLRFLNPNDEEIKNIADRIVVVAECGGVKICYAKAMLSFVKENIEYVNDPPLEYVKSARETLLSKAGDCDDQTVLLANLMQAVGFETRFVFIKNHVYLEAKIPDAPGKYQKNGWVAMDVTCEYCGLGDSSYKSQHEERVYV